MGFNMGILDRFSGRVSGFNTGVSSHGPSGQTLYPCIQPSEKAPFSYNRFKAQWFNIHVYELWVLPRGSKPVLEPKNM